ncbi:MAG: putative toxin-antitoxin system toxin component, PIN family [Nitrospirae bacterium CG_4_10_14_3_um_filter_44_29]|nr:putative toxin-antitoxin system toxin component, PIN family [Nitrospirota bacterium]OIO29375.1 MAG: putative toxin-antitoxin system toxin component, PIN family [Nitrospirae bacterium CG1_02_44_142]PIV41760.1 MAG: putative toxin-antitoxin system toxin component, PIN family [Nitrospirae bacterium CG02_land_8_20_14_3_00_44_33]PIX87528.1 MAG: putative toxin-antitoxin system toxin component, PIN family [Nitrospirae bacterium CG_4_10_14_3_um_filter_44_29]
MRVVLDSNVIIAAFASRGLCSEVFEVCLSGHSIVTSEHILSEVKTNLIKKIRLPESIVKDIMEYLRDEAERVNPSELTDSPCRDKDDNIIIGTALSGNAEFIITGDEDLLVLKTYKGIDIITPREFWSRLKG